MKRVFKLQYKSVFMNLHCFIYGCWNARGGGGGGGTHYMKVVYILTQTRNVRFTFLSVNSKRMQAFNSNVLLQ